MPLETASFINQLEPANPAGTDPLSQGDDHLRLLKSVLKATFPNLTGPVTKTQAELNGTGFVMPAGLIAAWYGTSETVPAGWVICNGQTVPKADGSGNITTPNLTNRVVIGAGTTAAQGATTGATTSSATTSSTGSHVHTINGGAHGHTVTVEGATTAAFLVVGTGPVSGGGGALPVTSIALNNGPAHGHVANANDAAHSHGMSTEGAHAHTVSVSTIQPSLGLYYIMKT